MSSDDKRRYSRVYRRMWNDASVRALSWPPPNGLTLWQRLLTGPELTCIPGLFPAWEAGLAQSLGWDLKGFREGFREVLSKGMAKADWEAGLVWVPKAITHNRPENPNVVIGWRGTWDELPECALKLEAYHTLKSFVEGLGKGFAEGFAKSCPKPSGKGLANQEQEQEQEQSPQSPRRVVSEIPPDTARPASAVGAIPDPSGDFEIADQWAQGVTDGSGSRMSVPRGGALRRLLDAAQTHGPARAGSDGSRIVGTWLRERSSAWGASVEGTRNVFRFCDWLDSGNGAETEPEDDYYAGPEPPPRLTEAERQESLATFRKLGILPPDGDEAGKDTSGTKSASWGNVGAVNGTGEDDRF